MREEQCLGHRMKGACRREIELPFWRTFWVHSRPEGRKSSLDKPSHDNLYKLSLTTYIVKSP